MSVRGDSGSRDRTWAAVLFDLDGTLADTVEVILRCYRHTMRVHRGEELPDEEWLRTIGTPLRDQLLDFARDPDEAAAMLETYTSYQSRVHDELVRPFDGAHDVMRRLTDRGVRLGIVTSKSGPMARRTVAGCGFEGFAEVLVTADDVEHGKPHPEPVESALKVLGVTASRSAVLFVGDSPYDVRAGRDAGVRTAGALWGPYSRDALEREGPDHLLMRLGDVVTTAP